MGATTNTALLFMFMAGLFLVVGWAVGAFFLGNWVAGAIFFLFIAAAFNIFSYFYSSKIVLYSYRAKIVEEHEAPRLHKIIRNIAFKADLPMPKVAIVPSSTPNAFATGRNPKNAVVAATNGILNLLDDEELEGVLAHEMAHVKDRDILVMSIAATLAGAISFAARAVFWGTFFGGGRRDNGTAIIALIAAITAPIAAMMVQMAISRSREFKADEEGARMLGTGIPLANALERLESANSRNPIRFGNPASSHIWIVNPFRGGTFVKLFSTHPPIEERVRRLREMDRKLAYY